ncbi:hypothetical protein G9A89_004997 [Geosiphon pyriformis]|nr:hypothetical protein G9A89_004997 [Geosiphon pyriformis]
MQECKCFLLHVARSSQYNVGTEICRGIPDAKTAPRNPNGMALFMQSFDPGVRTLFTWHSPTKGTGKTGEHSVGRIVCIFKYLDDLICKKDKLKDYTKNCPEMLCWAHYRFGKCLIGKAEELDVRVTT